MSAAVAVRPSTRTPATPLRSTATGAENGFRVTATDDGSASGFVFHAFNADALRHALQRAFDLHRRPADWARAQRHAMQLRFDWKVAAQAYCSLYQRIAATPGTAYASSLDGSR